MIDLITERVGGVVLACNDEFFAEAANLLKASPPLANDEYTDRGKWMDGWETRRRRQPGHDWVAIRLGIPGRVRRVTVDTSHFTGNFPEQFSLDAAGVDDPDTAEWVELIPRTALSGDSVASFELADPHRVTLVRLNIYPDGGVARLRIEGDPIPEMTLVCPDADIDMASAAVGGEVVDASDLHYSHPSNCLRPTESAGMWDGWETRRRRDAAHDWIVVRLGLPGRVHQLVVDTRHFKGNAPGWVSAEVSADGQDWAKVVDRFEVKPDAANIVGVDGVVTGSLLRLSIHPDGGLARVRVLGRADRLVAATARLGYLNSLFRQSAISSFTTASASRAWVETMVEGRPYLSVEAVLDGAEVAFDGLEEEDWLEAFAGHPRIGERGDAVADREQSGTATASRATLRALIDVNRRYEDKFGFTYIVYATGKTAEEMLEIARGRLDQSRQDEIVNASREQRKITRTRLLRMLCQEER